MKKTKKLVTLLMKRRKEEMNDIRRICKGRRFEHESLPYYYRAELSREQWRRLAIKLIDKINGSYNEFKDMDYSMDGSGECGWMIEKSHYYSLNTARIEFEGSWKFDLRVLEKQIEEELEDTTRLVKMLIDKDQKTDQNKEGTRRLLKKYRGRQEYYFYSLQILKEFINAWNIAEEITQPSRHRNLF